MNDESRRMCKNGAYFKMLPIILLQELRKTTKASSQKIIPLDRESNRGLTGKKNRSVNNSNAIFGEKTHISA